MDILAAKIHAGSPKVRWNACHAIAKVLLCPALPLSSVTWAPSVLQALLSAIAQQENFKVRISACSALRVPVSRGAYGSFYPQAVMAIVDALETASDLKDVTEFRYKEQLETQLSFTLVHLIYVATEEDQLTLDEALQAKPTGFLYDWLFHNLHRMTVAMEREQEAATADAEDGGTEGSAGGATEMHDVNPIKKDELLSAVRTLLRLVRRDHEGQPKAQQSYMATCLSLLYDAKLSLERDVLYSQEDLAFEF